MTTYLQENVINAVFRGTCVNGAITISEYFDTNAESVKANTLRGSVVIANGEVIGYVANNTTWVNGGFVAYLAYNNRSISGNVDFMFVFPAGRLNLNTVQIFTKAQGPVTYKTDETMDTSFTTGIVTTAKAMRGGHEIIEETIRDADLVCGIMTRTNLDNRYDNDSVLQSPPEMKVRGGVRVNY